MGHTHQQSQGVSHKSCWVNSLDAVCFIFVIRTPVIGRDSCCFMLGYECRKVDSF